MKRVRGVGRRCQIDAAPEIVDSTRVAEGDASHPDRVEHIGEKLGIAELFDHGERALCQLKPQPGVARDERGSGTSREDPNLRRRERPAVDERRRPDVAFI